MHFEPSNLAVRTTKKNVDALKGKFEVDTKPSGNLTRREFLFGKRDQKKKASRRLAYGVESPRPRFRVRHRRETAASQAPTLGIQNRQLKQKTGNDNPTFAKVMQMYQRKELQRNSSRKFEGRMTLAKTALVYTCYSTTLQSSGVGSGVAKCIAQPHVGP